MLELDTKKNSKRQKSISGKDETYQASPYLFYFLFSFFDTTYKKHSLTMCEEFILVLVTSSSNA